MQQAGAASGESKAVALDPISEAQDLVPRIKQSLVVRSRISHPGNWQD